MKARFKIIAILQAVIQVWVPVCLLFWSVARPLPAYADRFSDTARQGQTMGRGLVPNPSTLADRDEAGNVNLHWQGQTSTFNPGALFPDEQNTTDPHADEAFGNDAQVMSRANSETQAMGNSQSLTGQAYRTLMGSTNRARVDMSNDPLWQQTDAAIDRAMSGVDSNCEIITGTNTVTTQAHVPDLQTCERVWYPGAECKCYHDYTVEYVGQYSVEVRALVRGSVSISVNVQTGQILSCSGCLASQVTTSPPTINICAVPPEGVMRTVSNYTPYAGASCSQMPYCSNGLTAGFSIQNTSHNPEWLSSGILAVNVYHIVDRGWTCDPGCEVLLANAAGDDFIRPASYTCTLGPCETSAQIGGAWVSQSELYSTNPFASVGISNLAHKVTIALENFNQGPMNCWTDPQGEVHCPENPGGLQDTCEALQNNPNCSFVRQECIEGAQDPESGVCYAWTVVYDCGSNVGIDDVTTTMGYVCDGVIRCMGEECVDGQFDVNNGGFARAAAMMQVTQYAAGDMDCTSHEAGDGCKIWTGDLMRCKKALGGWVDCCTKPEGVSLVSYINLLQETFTLTSAEWDMEGILPGLTGNPLSGTWADLSTYTEGVTNFLSNTFSSAWDSLVGSTEAVGEASGPVIGEALSQRLMESSYDILSNVSPDLANAIFEVGEITGVVFSEGMMTLMSVVSFISWIYTIYNILDILVHIIWACEEDELELGAKRQLKVCHYVGSYCHSDIIGICIEKRESYCCYNSPLARIMQEQIRKQGIGGGWGSAKNPKCEGLKVSELASVNWDSVDLSEWLALLSIGGVYPTQKDVSIEGLTGSGSQFNFNNTSTPRPNAAQRTQDRITESGEDLEQLRIQGGLNLWGQGLQH